ncbi:MAG: SH3-like domain-containing protein [Chloroflexi bacterium]|uniref:SH3 domain-containing protein n=1 Tax=Candidatus Flexifilum breve TaxID=3140694 RepID=UPI003135E894|nr:SH3-like domain-containing protein [Chloroflexota bacterium]
MRVTKSALLFVLFLLFCLPFSSTLAQNIPDALFQTALRTAQANLNTTEDPLTWRYTLERSRNSSLGCPVISGSDLGTEVVFYNVIITFTSGDFNVRVSVDGALIVACDTRAMPTATPLATATPLGAAAPITGATPTPPSCILTPNGGVSNVRSEPSTDGGDATVVAQITLPTPAVARTSDGSWFRIANGWVAASVVETTGDCASLPLNEAGGGDQNPLSFPYCTLTTTAQGNLITAFVPDFTYGAQYLPGQTYLVLSQTASELGTLARVLINATTLGWIPTSSGTLTEGCAAFLAPAPTATDTTCSASIGVNGQAVIEPEGQTGVFGVEVGDRYAIRNRIEIDGEGWLQITTFGVTPDGWIAERQNPYSPGCEAVLSFSNTPRLNAGFRTPYCVASVTAPTVIARNPSTPDQVLAQTITGDRLLVVSRTTGSSGDWYRILLHGGELGWVNATSTTLSAGCPIFLAQAPGMVGERLQCIATVITDGIAAYPAAESTADPLFLAGGGDRFAALEAVQTNSGRWLRLGTFGLTPNAWISADQVSLSPGCAYAIPEGAPPAASGACQVTPVNLFVNVRSQPESDGTYTGVIGQLFSATPAIGRSGENNWYQVEGGWVAAFLVTATGNCAALPVTG